MQGWIKLHRKVLDNYLFQENRNFSKFEAWTYLLLTANHSDNKFLLGNELIELKAGQMITSELKLMDKFNWSKSKLRNFLKLLQQDNMIVKVSDTKKTTLSIVKYRDYQTQETTEKPLRDHEETAKELRKDTNKNVKKDNNDKECLNKETIKGVYEFFNLERKDLPEAIKLNDSRKKLIKCRLEEYDQDTIKKVILKARDNNFLSGKETSFKANFDWIFNKTNFLKILEGNYENEKTNFGKDKPAFKLKTNRPI
jgi:hypothetical protein